jgi:hypothetical protein
VMVTVVVTVNEKPSNVIYFWAGEERTRSYGKVYMCFITFVTYFLPQAFFEQIALSDYIIYLVIFCWLLRSCSVRS